MTDPISFRTSSTRFGLPFLFPGQAQKEFYINEAHALLDALLHPVVEGVAATPPPSPADGSCWLVGQDAQGPWSGQEGRIACWQAGNWLMADPAPGMRVYDKATGQEMRHADGWIVPATLSPPMGGEAVDVQAREAIGELIEALAKMGLVRQVP